MSAQPITIRIKKMADGSAALTCTRADGSTTWQRQNGKLGQVFPHHDLTHYAVETELGYAGAFYGLIAQGWDISDFAAPWPRGEVPAEAREVEFVVGLFDMERRVTEPLTSVDFADVGEKYASASSHRVTIVPPVLTDEMIDRVRMRRTELFALWSEVAPGSSLELHFEPTPQS